MAATAAATRPVAKGGKRWAEAARPRPCHHLLLEGLLQGDVIPDFLTAVKARFNTAERKKKNVVRLCYMISVAAARL